MASTFFRPTSFTDATVRWNSGTSYAASGVNGTTPNDSTYFQCNQTGSRIITFVLGGSTPPSIGGAILRVRNGWLNATNATHFIKIELDGVEYYNDVLPSAWTTMELSLTTAQAAALNLGSLNLNITSIGASSVRRTAVSWIELEILEATADDSQGFFMFF